MDVCLSQNADVNGSYADYQWLYSLQLT